MAKKKKKKVVKKVKAIKKPEIITSKNQYTINDLQAELERRSRDAKSKRKSANEKQLIRDAKNDLAVIQEKNRKTENDIRKQRRIIKNPKSSKVEIKTALNKLANKDQSGLFKIPTSEAKNKVKRLTGKDFYYTIDDGFGQYRVKASTLKNKNNPSLYLLSNYEKQILEAEKEAKLKTIVGKDGKRIKKSAIRKEKDRKFLIVAQKIKEVISVNKNRLKSSMKGKDKFFNVRYKGNERVKGEDGEYAVLMDFAGNNIVMHL